jgi:hypothetical protein
MRRISALRIVASPPLDPLFVPLARAPMPPRPPERSLRHPPPSRHLEAPRIGRRFDACGHPDPARRLLDDYRPSAEPLAHPARERPPIAAIGPDQRQARRALSDTTDEGRRPVAISAVRGMGHDTER